MDECNDLSDLVGCEARVGIGVGIALNADVVSVWVVYWLVSLGTLLLRGTLLAMGYLESFYTVAEVARISLATTIDVALGRLTISSSDQRLEDFANRILNRADVAMDVVGAQNIPGDRACVFMSNHQSHFDIPILYHALRGHTIRMVGKVELFRIPLWGRAMRAGGMIEINRSSREQAIASLKRASVAITDGISIWIAPEGHRSRDGSIGPLKKGGFHLARDTGAEIVPVAICGSGNILPPGTLRVNRGIAVRVVIGAPIPSADRELDELSSEVRDFFVTHVEKCNMM